MKVNPVPFDLDLTQNAPGYVRSPGLHLSDIYGAMYQEREPKRYGQPMSTGAKAGYMGAGLALEEALERSLASRLASQLGEQGGRPGELIEPEFGIIYSPDLIVFVDRPRMAEIKLTWVSSSQVPREKGGSFPPKFDKYWTQMKLYGRCLDMPFQRLYALFVNGNWDYKTGFKPEPLAWDIEFTQREMDEEWAAAINFAKQRGMLK